MQVFGYYDITSKKMLNAVRGAGISNVSLPTIVAGEALRFNIRFRETRDGAGREINPNVRAMKAAIGNVDTRPTGGDFKLILNDLTTEFITFAPNSAGVDANFAANVQAALVALTGYSSGDVEVFERNGSLIIVFPNDEGTEQTFDVDDNRLHPRSFVRVRSYLRGNRWEHELRLLQAPLAFTSTFERENGPVPTVESLRDGGEIDDVKWSEIQSLYLPPTFPGTIRLTKDQKRSDPISPKSTVDDIALAIERLADAGGVFKVTNPVDYHVYIDFGGDMTGTNYANLGVEVFDGPQADYVVALDTKTREMADLMQRVDNAVLILEIHAEIEDAENPGNYTWHALYRQQVQFREAVDWDELATAPNIDWLNPPTFTSYRPFSPNQVSNGQIHYSTVEGDGAATTFVLPHGLNTDTVQVIITENVSPGGFKVPGTHYTWNRNNANQITVTWLDGTPANDSLLITVLGLAQTSFFDPHEHEIDEIVGLREWMTDMENRVTRLERSTGGTITTEADEKSEVARWSLPKIFELYPSRIQPTVPASGRLFEIDLNEKDENGRTIISRGRGLLPAIHDAVIDNLPTPVPTSSFEDYLGKVYLNATGGDVLITTGMGNRALTVKAGDHVGCDGRGFYPMTKYDEWGTGKIIVPVEGSDNRWTFSFASSVPLRDGTRVDMSAGASLPGGYSAGTYIVRDSNFALRTFTLENSLGVVADFSSTADKSAQIGIASTSTFYPKHFERTLFEIPINGDQLRYRKELSVAIAFELAVLKSNTKAQWAIMFEIGDISESSLIGTPNRNLAYVTWRAIPMLERVLHLSASATTHRFGLNIKRRLLEGIDTFTAQGLVYGALENGLVPPRTGDFFLRARLGKFDTEDNQFDPKGLVVVSGLNIEPLNPENKSTIEYGYAVIA